MSQVPSELFHIDFEDVYHADEFEPSSSFELNIEENDYTWEPDEKTEDTLDLGMLPHQLAAMEDTTSKVLGVVTGYGGGKTWMAARKLLQLASLNPGTDLIATEPNFPLLSQILIPEIHDALKQFGLKYTYKATENIFYVEIDGQVNRLICKSMENYDRLIGINASGIVLDEFDTTKPEVAYAAFIKLLGRLRAGTTRQLVIVTTPEGYGAAYRIFVTEKIGKLIQAKTTDNIFLPDDFIETMYAIYPDNLIEAYINGEFVNMKSFTVFNHFDRKKHHRSITIGDEDKEIYLGGDFNAGGSVTLSAIFQDDKIYVFDEHLAEDTFDTEQWLAHTYRGKHLYGSFDATGSKKTSNASQSDLDILSDAGVSLLNGQSNPHIQDSVLSVNHAFRTEELFIDVVKCPELAKAVEQLAYDEVTGKPEKFMGPATIDDYTDALRYLIWALKPVTKVTFSTYDSIGNLRK